MHVGHLRGQSKLGKKYLLRPSPHNHPIVVASKLTMARSAPPEAPPATSDLLKWFPGIRDQGSEGSCTGFSTATCREVRYGAATGKMIGFRLSPAYLYARTRMAEGTFPTDSGAFMVDEFATLQAFGVCPETDMPYDQDPAEPIPAIADVAAKEFMIESPTMVDYSNPDNIKVMLARGYPIGIAITVYSSFEECPSSGKLKMPDKNNEQVLGGHGLAVLGYNDYGWIVPNQWGEGFGDKGFCYMPYGYEKETWMEAWTMVDVPA